MSWIWPAGGGASGGGGAPARYPQLTQTLYSPWAQWAMDWQTPPTSQNDDRSGNSRTLAWFSTVRPGPSPRAAPATGTVLAARVPGQSSGASYAGANATTFPGAMTVTCKVWWRQSSFAGDAATAEVIFGASGVADPRTTAWLYVSDVGHLGCFWDGMGAKETTAFVPVGRWFWVSMQRDTDLSVRLGIDGVYQSFAGPLPAQTALATAILRVGCWAFAGGNGQAWAGGFEDLSVWNTRLTDTQLEDLRRYAMGV
jgi:hypothetical protein